MEGRTRTNGVCREAGEAPGWHDLSPLILSDCSPLLSLSLSLRGRCRLISYPAAITRRGETAERACSHLCIFPSHICTSPSNTFLSLALSSPFLTYVRTPSTCLAHAGSTVQPRYVQTPAAHPDRRSRPGCWWIVEDDAFRASLPPLFTCWPRRATRSNAHTANTFKHVERGVSTLIDWLGR